MEGPGSRPDEALSYASPDKFPLGSRADMGGLETGSRYSSWDQV